MMRSPLQKNTGGNPGFDSHLIEAGEKAAVREMLADSRIPTPSGSAWDAIVAYYNLPAAQPIDEVQSRVTLPPGWKIEKNSTDPYGRCCIIRDHEGKEVGDTFLKNTGYDYYGSTNFSKDRLKALGIICE
jgi:hypothetical protein